MTTHRTAGSGYRPVSFSVPCEPPRVTAYAVLPISLSWM
jgi:hypothetical protein